MDKELWKEGYSKNTFVCSLCNKSKYAHEFNVEINKNQTREIRIICVSCVDNFNSLKPKMRTEIVIKKLETFFGEKQFIYGLYEPIDNTLQYIGRSKNVKARYTNHLQQAKKFTKKLKESPSFESKLFKSFYSSKKWIADLANKNLKPKLEILEEVCPSIKACEQEMRWVCQAIKEKESILNVENNSKEIKNLIETCDFSFKEVSLDYLITSNLIFEIDSFTSSLNRESGWRMAILVHNVIGNKELLATT